MNFQKQRIKTSSCRPEPTAMAKTRRFWLIPVGLIVLLGISGIGASTAHAQQADATGGTDVGGFIGLDVANQDIGTHIAYGATGHVRLMPELNAGLYFQYFSNSTDLPSGASVTNHYSLLMAEANYLFTGPWQGAYAGVKAGLNWASSNLVDSTTDSAFAIGGAFGYDYFLANNFSVGGQVNLITITSSPNLTQANFLALLKYQFG